MEKIEIKEIGVKSAFKTIIYLMSIPLGIMFIVGILTTIIGTAIGQHGLALGLPFIIMPFFMIFLYGLLGMLIAIIYNYCAKRYGGLEIKFTQKENELDIISIDQ